MIKILVVEDDLNLNHTLCKYLSMEGYNVVSAIDVNEAYDYLYGNNFDLIISDIMMPKIDGFEFLENVRNTNKEIPFIFITAKEDFKSKEKGFRLGVDDFMVKPIDLDELSLRIRAILRRSNINRNKILTIGNLTINKDENTVLINNEEISFTLREFNLLYKLLSYPKKTFTRNQLLDEFQDDKDIQSRTVDVYITKLREKCKECDGFEIQTVHGLGYKAVLK
ncbi:MAG: response regulator transcription factor [Acholeplasmatales bacterium]|nr:response regulator transcription factor [Acholeplasmatales bacterium]